MNTDPTPSDRDGELLSAWLADELSAAEAAALERRLAAEPELAARLDALHDALVVLQGLDRVALPAGAGERLRARLAGERDRRPATEDAAVADLGARRAGGARPARRAVRWPAVAAAAAAVVAILAVVPVLQRGMGGGGTGDVAMEAAEEPAESQALQTERALGADDGSAAITQGEGPVGAAEGPEGAAEGAGEQEDAARPLLPAGERPQQPAIGDAPTAVPAPEASPLDASEDQALVERLATAPEATGLLGLPTGEAGPVASQFSATVRRAPDLAGAGAPPSACLDPATAAVDGETTIPARVESVTYDGQPAIAYVLVSASPGAVRLDRIDVVVTDPATCAILFTSPG